jgi:hypothetical protein
MSIHGTSLVAAAVIAASLAACGGGGSYDADELSASNAHAICSKLFECRASFPGGTAQFDSTYGTSEAGCEMAFLDDTGDTMQLQDSIDAGRIVIDGGAVALCQRFIDNLTCEEVWSQDTQAPAACEMEIVPQVADGDACVLDEDCVSDFCDSSTMTCAPG